MKQTKEFNNVPKSVLDKLKLKKGETITYKVKGVKPDRDNPGRFLIPSKNVPPTDRIAIGDEYVDIAYIKAVGKGGQAIRGSIWFTQSNGGVIRLTGGSRDQQELYEYLELSNYNASNENRDTGVTPIFERLDAKKDAQKELKRRGLLFKAMSIANEMTPQERRDFVAATGGDDTVDIDIINNTVEEFSEKKPERFVEIYMDKDNVMKAVIRRALRESFIEWLPVESKFQWKDSKEEICVVPRQSGGDHVEGLLFFIKTKGERGTKIFQEMKRLVDGVRREQVSQNKAAKKTEE